MIFYINCYILLLEYRNKHKRDYNKPLDFEEIYGSHSDEYDNNYDDEYEDEY